MFRSVDFDLSRHVFESSHRQDENLQPVEEVRDCADGDDDVPGGRNWAVLLIFLSVPVFFIAVTALIVWLV